MVEQQTPKGDFPADYLFVLISLKIASLPFLVEIASLSVLAVFNDFSL